MLAAIDALIARGGAYAPRWGFHDDHRALDKTPAYLPAIQQVRSEYAAWLAVAAELPTHKAALQLGRGPCRASHDALMLGFANVVTIDNAVCEVGHRSIGGASTSSREAFELAMDWGPYDLLFIDAGHSEDAAAADHSAYGQLVVPDGLIIFHDALPRADFPEIGVWRYLESVQGVTIIGEEVGTAWIRKQ